MNMSNQKRKNVMIFGFGGHAKVALDILQERDDVRVMGFVDDDPNKIGQEYRGVSVLGDFKKVIESVPKSNELIWFVAIGSNKIRKKVFNDLQSKDFDFVNALHPSAVLSKTAVIGTNVLIGANCVVNADAIVNDNSIINTGATVDHDCIIGKNAHIAPGSSLGGDVNVGDNCLLGIGVNVNRGINIGSGSTIVSGTTVFADIADNSFVKNSAFFKKV